MNTSRIILRRLFSISQNQNVETVTRLNNNIRKLAMSSYGSFKHIENGLTIKFREEVESNYHYIWLRDHCRCPKCFNSTTQQRQVDTFKIPLDIKPREVSLENGKLEIEWLGGHKTLYDLSWLQSHQYGQPYNWTLISDIKRKYWGREIQDALPNSVSYDEFINDDRSTLKGLENIAIYGFTFLSSTPTNLEALDKVIHRIGMPFNTLYGHMWEVTNVEEGEEMEHQDTAWLNVALNGHTDGTYFLQSPGLQLFHCHKHIGSGGENLFIDGIAAAEILRNKHPEAFTFLCKTHLPARYKEPGFVGRVLGPMIKLDPHSNEIYQVRINNDDRDVLSNLSYEDVEMFYDSLHKFMNILRDKNQELWIKLTPGNLIIVDNWRVLHGRASFTGTRTMGGCYMKKEDYLSKLRILREKFYGLSC